MLGPKNLSWLLPLGFVFMALIPFVLLSREGRRQIGLKRSSSLRAYPKGIFIGAIAATICGLAGYLLFGQSENNWYVSVSNYYRNSLPTEGPNIWQLHLFFTFPALIFSPIGEETYFRGVLQRSLEDRFPSKVSTLVEGLFFGIVHLCHHGIIATASGFRFLPLSGIIWVLLMTLTAVSFAWIRKSSDSLYPAILSHAAFNLTMNIIIFQFLW